ncbi:hypothetical protein K4K58_008407 [Colletotrichum sp. SAR11_239]|nr:hypothetical protein K4K58_008407 [Colletotrichum sp. SAR11_239]
MRSRRSHVTLGALSVLPWLASGSQVCPSVDDAGAITQEVVVVDHVPIHVSAAVCQNTVIDIAGTVVSVTNAPTVLVSDFVVQSTTTFTSTLHPSVVFEGPCTTLFRDGPPGSEPTTLVFPPRGDDVNGTKIICVPADPNWYEGLGPFKTGDSDPWGITRPAPTGTDLIDPATITPPTTTFTGPFATLTGAWTGTVPTTLILPPAGTVSVGTELILLPATTPPSFTGPYVTISGPYTGATPTTLALPPSGADTVGTQLVLTPSPVITSFTGPYVTATGAYTGTTPTTLLLPPSGTDTIGTQLVLTPAPNIFTGPFVTESGIWTGTFTNTLSLAPAGTDATGTQLILYPTTTASQFTGPFTTLTAPGTGSVAATFTVPPKGADGTGTVIVLAPTSAAPGTFAETGPSLSSASPTSAPVLGGVFTSTYTGSTTSTSVLPSGPNGEPGATIIFVPSPPATATSVPASSILPGIYTTITSGYDGTVTSTYTIPATGTNTAGIIVILEPTAVSSTAAASFTTVTSAYTGSVTLTSTIPPTVSGQPGTVVILDPTSACSVSLTDSCAQLSSTNGLALAPVIAACTLELGPYAAGNVLTCLSTTISLTTTGQSIANCVTNALAASCPTTLPDACVNLQTSNGLALLTDIPLCTAALGPFAVGTAATCLATGAISALTQGSSVFECLQVAFGLAPSVVTVTNPALCPTQAPTATPSVCATVPAPCESLSTVDGLALIPAIPACTAALGAFAVGNAATCLATTAISVTTTGSSIVSCLENALSATCISTLPQACLDLAGDDAVALAVDLPLCVTALGPFATGAALVCTTSGLTNGDSVIQCLNNALFSTS